MIPKGLKRSSSDSMATTMTLTDPERRTTTATTPKPGTPLEKSARASSDIDNTVPETKEKEEDTTSEEEDPTEYPTGLPLLFITTALCLAVFLVALDQTIIATAIPKITGTVYPQSQFHKFD